MNDQARSQSRARHQATFCLVPLFISVLASSQLLMAASAASSLSLEESLRPEIDAFVAQDKVALPAACQVLFVGSSSIVRWKATLADDMSPMPVINRGFGGSHIESVNRWFDVIVAPYKPRAIVFYAGENDIDAGESPERVIADFDAFMRRKEQALGNTPVYFISLKPTKLRAAEFPLQTIVNDALTERARRRADLHYIDVVAPMLQDGKPKDIFEPDGLHMNRAGYEIWTARVRAALLPSAEADERRCRGAR